MIEELLGVNNGYIVSGCSGKDFNENLKKLKKQLKANNRRIEAKITVRAIILTEEVK